MAYAGTNIPYYLLAIGLRNEVRYVNIDRHRDWLMHDYHRQALSAGREPGRIPGRVGIGLTRLSGVARQPRGRRDSASGRDACQPAEGAHNVADSDNFPIERQWADSHPERFEPLYGQRENDPWFRLYRMRRSKPQPSSRFAAAALMTRPEDPIGTLAAVEVFASGGATAIIISLRTQRIRHDAMAAVRVVRVYVTSAAAISEGAAIGRPSPREVARIP